MFRGTFDKTGVAGTGTVTVELEKKPEAANPYALSGKLKDGTEVLTLSGTYEPDLGILTASAAGNVYRYNIMGVWNGSGGITGPRAVVVNKSTTTADLFLVSPGGEPIDAARAVARDAGGGGDDPHSIPEALRGTWRTADSDHGHSVVLLTSDSLTYSLMSGTPTGYFQISKVEYTLESVKAPGADGIYNLYFSYPCYESADLEERKEVVGAYLDTKGVTGGDKAAILAHVVWIQYRPEKVWEEDFKPAYEIDWTDYYLGNFEQQYLKKKPGREAKMLYVGYSIKPEGQKAQIHFMETEKGGKEHYENGYYPSLDYIKSLPSVEFDDEPDNIFYPYG